jgi:acyl-[acyl-carrier-protein]-phospholipid O-acyltransferase/long-chain-fatty-acid--[acyl-carrier-protein] ligase
MVSPGVSSRLPRSFWVLNLSQALIAFGDNVFRFVMTLALIARTTNPATDRINETPIFIIGTIFAIPYILFSPLAGVVCDRFSKRRVAIFANLAAVVGMFFGLLAFLSNSPFLIYTALFLLITQSTFLSPCKLGLLPELLPREKLSNANGIMESTTYIAIILGSVVGTGLYQWFGAPEKIAFASTHPCWKAAAFCMLIAFAGYISSLFIDETGTKGSQRRASLYFWDDVVRNLRECRKNRYLFLSLFAVAYFLFLASFIQLNITPYGVKALGLIPSHAAYLFLFSAVGIGVGAFLAGRMSGRCIEIGLVPLGSILCAVSLLLFIVPIHSVILSSLLLLTMSIGGGFFIVPLNAFVQQSSPEEHRGEIIATANFLSFTGMILSAMLFFVLRPFPPGFRFVVLGLLTLGMTIAAVRVLPDFLIRFLGVLATKFIYRLETIGLENVPTSGGALLVSNHTSYIDAAFLLATQQRRIRFLMYRDIYESGRFNWLFRVMQCIPIAFNDPPKEIVRSLDAARQALDDGYLVCIFAEGVLTRSGYLNEFKRGFERIVKNSNYPIIPIHLHNVWGSTFSWRHGRIWAHWRRDWGRRVTIAFGSPMPAGTTAFAVRQTVMEMGTQAAERERTRSRALPFEFARMARSRWTQLCMSDTSGRRLSYGKTLMSAVALARALSPALEGQRYVGILLPSSVPGALTNLAVSFMGRVAVNLNYTSSADAIRSAIEQCGMRRIVTSRTFLEKLGWDLTELPVEPIMIEEISARILPIDKCIAFVRAAFFRGSWLVTGGAPSVEDTATVLFSSGSTGRPKGVELTHYNILANVRSVQEVFRTDDRDVIVGILPFFHAFGYTATLWLPLLGGFRTAFHTNPMETEQVGKLVDREECTILAATPTFLTTYARRLKREQFSTLRLVVVGAEKLRPHVATIFEERFDILPMEGYGATELSPVASVNLPDIELGSEIERACRIGTIGRPLPGVTMRVVEIDDYDRELPPGEEGLLLIKGPNVMKGYLNDPEKSAAVLHNGWYITGDVAKIDRDGFVTITDRLSRFSKIGGEMVPHLAIEEAIQNVLHANETVAAVTAIGDEKKGERLVVLLTPQAGDPKDVYAKLKEAGLPNLWLPSPRDFHVVEAIPVLGTGKIDLKTIRSLAEERSGKASAEG